MSGRTVLSAALLTSVVLANPLRAQTPGAQQPDPAGEARSAPLFADELPGYYDFYKRVGPAGRLAEEARRDESLEQGGDWSPLEVDLAAPDLHLPGPDGELLPLRPGGPGRNTVVTTFQAWW